MRPDTGLVRGGLTRTAFDETAEGLFLTSGYVYGSAEEAEAAKARRERQRREDEQRRKQLEYERNMAAAQQEASLLAQYDEFAQYRAQRLEKGTDAVERPRPTPCLSRHGCRRRSTTKARRAAMTKPIARSASLRHQPPGGRRV